MRFHHTSLLLIACTCAFLTTACGPSSNNEDTTQSNHDNHDNHDTECEGANCLEDMGEDDMGGETVQEELTFALNHSGSDYATGNTVDVEVDVLTGELSSFIVTLNGQEVHASEEAITTGNSTTFSVTLVEGDNLIEVIATSSTNEEVSQSVTLVATTPATAPVLTLTSDAIPAQTWDAQLTVSLQVTADAQPDILVNDEVASVTDWAQDDTSWTADITLDLAAGVNDLTLLARLGELTSESVNITIERLVDDVAPVVTFDTHSFGQDVLVRTITVQGAVEEESELDRVELVQGDTTSELSLDDENKFTFTLSGLAPGLNTFAVVAYDKGGNITEENMELNYGSRSAAGGSHSAVLFNQDLYVFGRNNKGQLGLGYTSSLGDELHASSPVLLPLPDASVDVASIIFSQNTSFVLGTDGSVYSWGDNDDGQLCLGDASTVEFDDEDRLAPTRVPGIDNAVAIARGYDHSMVLRADGSVWTCGQNSSGQLGYGDGVDSDVFTQVTELTDIIQVAAGSKSSYALDASGQVWAWGRNRYANLAVGTEDTESHPTPAVVAGLPEIAMLATGRDHVLALAKDGSLWAWGLNASTQVGPEMLGDPVMVATQIYAQGGLKSIYAQANQSFIVTTQDLLYGWGQNLNGTLGVSSEENLSHPMEPVIGLSDVRSVGIGALHSVAQTASGEAYAWGWSFEGSLGGGSETIDRWAYRVPLLVDLPYADQ